MAGKFKTLALGAALFAGFAIGGAAIAQQLDPGISCVHGEVASQDWAELQSKYKESIWDSKAAIRLVSENEALELLVTDLYGNTVCEDTADRKVRCKFSFASSYAGFFNIRVDNFQLVTSRYRLCAE